jgi:AcrR family transcriptional regulator
MPKIVDHDKYRRELADKCMELFTRKGYANVTMREISKSLGVSTGLLYHYFPTKEAIFAHMADHLSQSDVAAVLERVDDRNDTGVKLKVYGEHWTDKKRYYQSILLLAIDFFRNYEGLDKDAVKREYIRYYVNAMAENLGVSEELARFIYVHMIGLMYYDLMLPGGDSFKRQLDMFERVFMAEVERSGRTGAAKKVKSKIKARSKTS